MKNYSVYVLAIMCAVTMMRAHSTIPFPFQIVPFNPGEVRQVAYSFTDANGLHPLIFCYQSSGTAVITWPYQNSLSSYALPLTLTSNANYTGLFANLTGTLTLQNTSNTLIFISCQYAF